MKTTMLQGEKWRQYGVMVKDTPETLGGMLRIERKNGSGIGDAVAFAIDQETADTIIKAVNCHDDLLEACKALVADGECSCVSYRTKGQCPQCRAREVIDRATIPQKEGAK